MRTKWTVILHMLVLLISVRTSFQECGGELALGRSIMLVVSGGVELVPGFDHKLFTHFVISKKSVCYDEACTFPEDPELRTLLEWGRPKFPQEMGIFFLFDKYTKEYLIGNRVRHTNTINALVDYMEDEGLTFVITGGAISPLLVSSQDVANYTLFLKELSEKLHSRGLGLGQGLFIERPNVVSARFNVTEVGKLVDWFYISPFQQTYDGFIEPIAPLEAYRGKNGTTKFWVETFLKLMKPQCLVVDLGPRLEVHTAKESVVDPGLGSTSALVETDILEVSKACYQLLSDDACREYWDDESKTPWALCGNDFYTYDNARSLKLKAELLKRYYVSAVMLWGNDITAGNLCGGGDPLKIFKAVQSIREK